MKRLIPFFAVLLLVAGCGDGSDPVGADFSAESALDVASASAKGGVQATRPLKMSKSALQVAWAVDRAQELACGGSEIAGGASSGPASFTHLGKSTLTMSAAWDIGNQLPSAAVQFEPVGPAGGPVAPVLGQGDYPYAFHFDPFTGACGSTVTATGDATIIAANGDEVHGVVTGGETHRLDFLVPGDGVETFAIIEIIGGTGRFAQASGSFVAHSITRFDLTTGRFVIDFAEVMPDGTITY